VIATQVLVVGGGPVGMTLANALAFYGVRSVLVEKNPGTTTHPKMDITNARSMEIFRKTGLADALRAVAIPDENPFDVAWITKLNGHELHRFRYPSAAESLIQIRRKNDGTQPSEAPMRVSQVLIEPVLKTAIEQNPLIEVMFGWAFESFTRCEEGVTAQVVDGSGKRMNISAEYLVGCDGGGSLVRKQLGISLSGKAQVSRRYITHFRSDARQLLQRWGKAWHYQSNLGTLVAQNDHDTWTLLSRIPDDVEPEDVDPARLIETFVGEKIAHEILVANSWSPHLLVADSYGQGRVLLAGDAVHQYIPTGGYGMNTGIGDAFDLAWKLGALVQGFGGEQLLASYESERRPVGLANCTGSEKHNQVRVQIAGLYTPELDIDSDQGELQRQKVAASIAAIGNAENECAGLELGYCYRDSPIICSEDNASHSGNRLTVDDPLEYRPSTEPGARLPSVFLGDGKNIYQLLGPWFTLLCFESCDTEMVDAVAAKMAVPLQITRIDLPGYSDIYHSACVLVRPDQHVAWRGAMPVDEQSIERILSRVVGKMAVDNDNIGCPDNSCVNQYT